MTDSLTDLPADASDDASDDALAAALAEIVKPQELEYVRARVAGMKVDAAARLAGYKDAKSGWRLEKRPAIARAMDAHRQELRKAIQVTHDDITEMLLEAKRMVASAPELVQVAQALSKHMGFEVERTIRIKAEVEKSIQVSGAVDVNTLHSLDDAALLQLAGLSGEDAPWIEGEAEEVQDT